MIYISIIDARKFCDEKKLNEALMKSSKHRLEKYNLYKVDEAKRQCIAATYLLDKMLSRYNLNEKDMEYEIGKSGKPYFKNHKSIYFNISHSKNLVMVAFSNIEVGCDIQLVKDVSKELYDITLSDEQKEIVLRVIDNQKRNEQFFKYWVMKETILKRDGIGLIDNMKEISDEKIYINKIILKDINEEYLYSVSNGKNEEIKIVNM